MQGITMNGPATDSAPNISPHADAREAQISAALVRCAAGDRAALKVIYDSEAPRMVGVARRILTRHDLAEEAVHDAFVRIWRGASGFDPSRGTARGWLYAIVRNRALSIVRSETRYDGPDPDTLELACDSAVTRMPETSALRNCLERIDRPRRDVVVLAYVHGLSHSELAARLKVPLGTIKSWVRRSMFSLQECMG
jgi:RNA polymerase sigma-70 factor (ECF subfamily)